MMMPATTSAIREGRSTRRSGMRSRGMGMRRPQSIRSAPPVAHRSRRRYPVCMAAPLPERVPIRVFDSSSRASAAVAAEIATLIRERAGAGRRTVLGLATGSTPQGVYEELVRLHREEGLSFRSVVTFNLDEYFPMRPEELQSYRRFMRECLFDHVDIEPGNAHVPDGAVARDQVA